MLTTVHRILIASSLGLGAVFIAFSVHRQSYVAAAAAAGLVAGLGAYFLWFLRKNRSS